MQREGPSAAAALHAELVARHGAGCSYETCGNAKLHQFIGAALVAPGADIAPDVAEGYQALLAAALTTWQTLPEVEGIEREKRVPREHRGLPPPAVQRFARGQ